MGVISTWFLGLIAAFMVVAVTLFYTLSNVPSPDTIQLAQTATIEYSDGSTLADYGSVDRTIVPLSQVNDSVKWAVLAAEDRNFYSEPGVSVKGTVRAVLSDLTGGDHPGRFGYHSAVRQERLPHSSRTLTRKIKELAISVKLARSYSKDQILEWYLNTVVLRPQTPGASRPRHRPTSASPRPSSTFAQAAVLAGLLRSPNYYDPANNLSESTARWHYVLDGMVTTGHLSAEDDAVGEVPGIPAEYVPGRTCPGRTG